MNDVEYLVLYLLYQVLLKIHSIQLCLLQFPMGRDMADVLGFAVLAGAHEISILEKWNFWGWVEVGIYFDHARSVLYIKTDRFCRVLARVTVYGRGSGYRSNCMNIPGTRYNVLSLACNDLLSLWTEGVLCGSSTVLGVFNNSKFGRHGWPGELCPKSSEIGSIPKPIVVQLYQVKS
jgi:hypothetical protein